MTQFKGEFRIFPNGRKMYFPESGEELANLVANTALRDPDVRLGDLIKPFMAQDGQMRAPIDWEIYTRSKVFSVPPNELPEFLAKEAAKWGF